MGIQLSPARVRLLAGTMIASGVLLLLGHLLTVSADQQPAAYVAGIAAAGPLVYYATAVMIAVGILLLPVWCIGALALAAGRGGAFVTVGAICVTAAAIPLGAGNFMFGAVMGSLVPADPEIARRVAVIADTQPAAGFGWQFAPLLQIGLVLIMIGFVRARTVPVWLAVVLAVGGVLIILSGAGGVLTALLLLPVSVGLAGVGVVVWRRPDRSVVAAQPGTDRGRLAGVVTG